MRALVAIALVALGCYREQPPAEYPDPSGGGVPGPLEIALTSPVPYGTAAEAVVVLTGEVTGAETAASVRIKPHLGPFEPAALDGTTFTHAVGLQPGWNTITVEARSVEGTAATRAFYVRYAGKAPVLFVLEPADGAAVFGDTLHVSGLASAVEGTLGPVEISVGAGAVTQAPVDGAGQFAADVPLGGDTIVHVSVRDDAGRVTAIEKAVVRDATPPAVAITSPPDGATTDQLAIVVAGTATDASGIAAVRVQVNAGPWDEANLEPSGTFEAPVQLDAGENVIRVEAEDLAGGTGVALVAVHRARVVTLHAPPKGDQTLSVTLDKSSFDTIVPDSDKAGIVLLNIDLEPLLVDALKAIIDPKAYGIDTGVWGQAEWNLWKLLNMTPDNADFKGTVMENALGLGKALGLPPAKIVAAVFGIGVTDPFLSVGSVSRGIVEGFVKSHPAVFVDPKDGKAKVSVTLLDAYTDMATLAEKLGPKGGHPGIVAGADGLKAKVLQSSFAVHVKATSHLLQREGIDLSEGLDYLFVQDRPGELVTFDFLSSEGLSVTGLADNPTMTLRFHIPEYDGFAYAGTSQYAGKDGEFYKGDGDLWTLPPWTLEAVTGLATYLEKRDDYSNLAYQNIWTYAIGDISDALVVSWDKGWLIHKTVAGLGSPPPPVYVWDLISETAQIRMHDGGLSEGEAGVTFDLSGVELPMSAAQMIEEMRPHLQAQQAKMSDLIVGDHSTYSSLCDVFLTRGDNGALYLAFVAPSDIPGSPYAYPNPGLFTDPGLTAKASATADDGSGDSAHEKLRVDDAAGKTFYAADADGTVWRLDLLERDGDALRIRIGR